MYAPPDPIEYLPLPRLAPREGEYVLQIVEPLEEVVYLDEVKLVAVDHPAGTEILPREMAVVSGSPPPPEIFCYREPIFPLRAVDHRGADVTEKILRADRQYACATERDARFIGYAKDHWVELDFGDRLRAVDPALRPVLVLEGWVEYPYSSTNFAAAQAGLRLKAPSVSVFREGQWVELLHEVGYPAGVNHAMAIDLSGKLLPGDAKIRVASNMEIYWDRIFLAPCPAKAPIRVREIAARSADLHFRGYPREYSPDGREPRVWDYHSIDRSAPWKRLAGSYTRYGDVGALLRRSDDRFVIMSPGDEVTLRFAQSAAGPIPADKRRSWLLKTDSFSKDMDLHTAFSDTVEPLPFHAMSGYPYPPGERYPDTPTIRDYRERYNTRCLPWR
jgi:hypothetical protein